MAGLRLGPLLRYVDGATATVWVETDRPCEAEVVCDGSSGTGPTGPADSAGNPGSLGNAGSAGNPGGRARTWRIAGHHYALVTVTGLAPGTSTVYRVLLDGEQVWPLPGSGSPPSTIRTPPDPAEQAALTVAFGSCRWAAPPPDSGHDPVGPDALATLARRIAQEPEAMRPDVLLLLGDQVYADETSEATRAWLATRRDPSEPPGYQVADYAEYTRLYDESWLDPEVRWLLSTVPSCMIFDDHDVIDDWNTSLPWLERMRATPWWRERVLGGLMSYWVYQHIGNLSPADLARDPLYTAVAGPPTGGADDTGRSDSAAGPDGTDLLRKFVERADADPASARWSYRRDLGRVRVLIVDTRAARVLDPGARAMLDEGEMAWLREQALADPGGCDHLLVGTSLPWLLPPAIHDAESWNAALCAAERGPRWARIAERVRQRGDLEHWAAFPASFDALTDLLLRAGGGPDAPATICVLSGDVHHAYVAEPLWQEGTDGGGAPSSRVLQLTCSPVHNSIPATMRLGFRFGWSRTARLLGRVLARHARLPRPRVSWRRLGGPWFGNQLMTLTLRGREARLRLDQARRGRHGEVRLVTALDTVIRPAAEDRLHGKVHRVTAGGARREPTR
jgi:hypothetical protein